MELAARQYTWPGGAAPGPTPAYWGLCFTAEQANSTVAMNKVGTPPEVNLLYSTDAANWSPFVVGTTTVTLASVGGNVWLKAGSGGNVAFGSGPSAYNYFSLSGQISASGSIMSILDGETETYTVPMYCFYRLFYGCGSLTTAPELPATTLTSRCYTGMFLNCTSLKVGPFLPAQTLASQCYISMFENCSSIESVKVAFSAWGSTTYWFRGASATGTFYCPAALGTNDTITRDFNHCPTGWTVVNI